jgi:hypothetical protein
VINPCIKVYYYLYYVVCSMHKSIGPHLIFFLLDIKKKKVDVESKVLVSLEMLDDTLRHHVLEINLNPLPTIFKFPKFFFL